MVTAQVSPQMTAPHTRPCPSPRSVADPRCAARGEIVEDAAGQTLLGEGQRARTASGRLTTPFPRVDTTSERKTANTMLRVQTWLLDNARAEADATGQPFWVDDRTPQQADRDLAAAILFT